MEECRLQTKEIMSTATHLKGGDAWSSLGAREGLTPDFLVKRYYYFIPKYSSIIDNRLFIYSLYPYLYMELALPS